jgi:phosphoribosylamine--glycine ligase
LEFETKRAVCIVLASKGYPGEFEKNLPIKWEEENGINIFHAGLKRDENGGITLL